LKSTDATKRFYAELWPQRAVLLRTALFLSRDRATAEDVVQETMMRAFKAIDQFEPGSNARAWLLAILRNARIDLARKRSRDAGHLSVENLLEEPAGESVSEDFSAWSQPQEILQSFSDQQMIDALKKLPDEIRLTLLLVDVEQMDHADAAKILAVPVGTIKSRAHRGRTMLRQALSPLVKQES
jgi:RNA polymerase sigma-70 factor, ECF subfamily